VIAALAGRGEVVLSDELDHASRRLPSARAAARRDRLLLHCAGG
jgi:7-keto-8-aminopelargonate synthetase-like enzyme